MLKGQMMISATSVKKLSKGWFMLEGEMKASAASTNKLSEGLV